jgi:GNAT superfamily N-acetyltransferase
MALNEHEVISIRNALLEDLDAIVLLLRQLWPDKEISVISLRDSFVKSLSLEGHFTRVALVQNELVGFCSLIIRTNLKVQGSLGNIDELVVDERMRGRKIGRLLLQDAEEIASLAGCKVLGLESSFHRTEAHRFYEDNGYKKQAYYITKALD